MKVNIIYPKPNGKIGVIVEQAPIENLIFEGGGPKGLVYVGAVEVLEQKGLLQQVKNVGGSSAGAMTALAVGLGYSADEIKEIVYQAELSDFMDVAEEEPTGFFAKLSRTRRALGNLLLGSKNKGRGLFLGDKLQQWVQETIAKRVQTVSNNLIPANGAVTFEQLQQFSDKFPELNMKTICFTGTNYTDKKLEIFSYHTTPTMPIDLAVRISMSLPWFFKSVKYNGKEYMDGGALDNYPMGIFDKPPYFKPGNKRITGEQKQNLCTLGLKVDSAEEIRKILWEGAKEDTSGRLRSLGQSIKASAINFAAGVDTTEASRATNQATYGKYAQRTIQIPDLEYSTFNFNLTEQDKDKLAEAGRNASQEWFKLYYDDAGIEIVLDHINELEGYLNSEEFAEIRQKYPNFF